MLVVNALEAFPFLNENQLEEIVLVGPLRPLRSLFYRQLEGRVNLLDLHKGGGYKVKG